LVQYRLKELTVPNIIPFEQFTEEYEIWFEKNPEMYTVELETVRRMLPPGRILEIGVGSGKFAEPLNIREGVEPSAKMAQYAKKRGIQVLEGVAEKLPLQDAQYDGLLMVTTICFIEDVAASFAEAYRVLRKGGALVVAFVDAESPIGKEYLKIKESDKFYRTATFYSAKGVETFFANAGFIDIAALQSLFSTSNGGLDCATIKEGYGTGSFVVLRGVRP
jgi:ubiquinone/menaquinone biosynthesis C-methylase UbiE